MKTTMQLMALLSLASVTTWVEAAELSPEIQLGSRGLVSLDTARSGGRGDETTLDFSDTSLLLGFRQKLYDTWRTRFAVGIQFTDAGSELGPVYFHQLVIKLEDETNLLRTGRTRLHGALIEFPTARDDDALIFSDMLNPMNPGDDSEPSQYGEVVEYAHVFARRFWVRTWAGHLRETSAGGGEAGWRMNAAGAVMEYRVPESQRWNRPRLVQLGAGYTAMLKRREADGAAGGPVHAVIAAAIVNLNPDPVHFLDLRHQSIFNLGLEEVTGVEDNAALASSRRLASLTSMRYLYRRLERPMLQVALSYGYSRLLDPAPAGAAHLVIANLFYRLGENFDLGIQGSWQHGSGQLAGLVGIDHLGLQLLLVYNVDESWNDQFDDRDSLLNLEHGYIP